MFSSCPAQPVEDDLEQVPGSGIPAMWPPDADGLLTRRAAAIEQSHHPTVVLEGSGTFVADDTDSLTLPDTSVPADVLRTDFLPYRSPRWFAVVDARGRVAWTHRRTKYGMLDAIARLEAEKNEESDDNDA